MNKTISKISLVFEGESGFTTHLRGGYKVIILAEAVIILSVCIIMKIVSKHSPFTTFVDSYTFEAWGARSRMPMLLCDLDLSEIACTPAIGSWTLTTRGTIFKWQSQESWTNSIRPRKFNDWNKRLNTPLLKYVICCVCINEAWSIILTSSGKVPSLKTYTQTAVYVAAWTIHIFDGY